MVFQASRICSNDVGVGEEPGRTNIKTTALSRRRHRTSCLLGGGVRFKVTLRSTKG